jgi:hypothetical protein
LILTHLIENAHRLGEKVTALKITTVGQKSGVGKGRRSGDDNPNIV